MKGEHAEGQPVRSPLVRRALQLRGSERTSHRRQLGSMSTSLLNELMTDHLDGGYAAAARRKEARAAARAWAAEAGGSAEASVDATSDAAGAVAGGTASSRRDSDAGSAAAGGTASSRADSDAGSAAAGGVPLSRRDSNAGSVAAGGVPSGRVDSDAGPGSVPTAEPVGAARPAEAAIDDRPGVARDAAEEGGAGLTGAAGRDVGRPEGRGWRWVGWGTPAEWETKEERRAGQLVLSVGLLLVGVLLAVAYRGTIRTAPESERARQALVRDVEAGSAVSDSLQRQAETLSGQLVRERDSVLTRTETGERATREVRRLEAAAALIPVTGPGITVVVGDASAQEQVDPATGETVSVPADDNGRLRDRDLQSVVNALWAAGAEAISVGGERLAPTTTIRAAGEAILVDLRPVTSPYAIEAVGNPDTLLPRFADSDAARRYQSYTGLYGIRFTVTRQDSLTLRAATGPELRYAEPTSTPGPSRPAAGTGTGTPTPGTPTPTGGG